MLTRPSVSQSPLTVLHGSAATIVTNVYNVIPANRDLLSKVKITAIETIHLSRGITVHWGPIQWLWVRVHTDAGITGLGECYPLPGAEKAVIHKTLSSILLGRDPMEIDRRWRDMFHHVAFCGWAGAEIRAISAVDIALWDIAGKALNTPVYQLLGGTSRDAIPTYNTCYDHVDFHKDPVELARQLLESGITRMKIWPFDPIAIETGGQTPNADQMRRGLAPLRLIREHFGDSIEVAMEFHGYWTLPAAIKIAHAVEEYSPMWLEEMLPQDNLRSYAELAAATNTPLCISERLMTRYGFRELMENQAARIIMPDICWCGGISEARKIASMSETWHLPVAPHNCGGPVLHAASLHLAANLTNLYVLESVRRHYHEEYAGLVTETYPAMNGSLPLPFGPGLGVELTPAVWQQPGIEVEITKV